MNEVHRRKISNDFRVILALITFFSILGLFQNFFHILDLLNHFRLQAIVGSIFCFICFLCMKDRIGLLAAFLVLLLNVSIVVTKIYQTSGIPSVGSADNEIFSIVSANLLSSNTDYEAVLSMVRQEDADVIFFTEVNEKWDAELQSLKKHYPYFVEHPRPDNFGMSAYSRKPFKEILHDHGVMQVPLLMLDIDNVVIIGAHPLPPSSISTMSDNRAYLQAIAERAISETRPFIIAGDLNSTLWSSAFAPLITAGLKRVDKSGIQYTWPVGNILYAMQIDHILAKGIKAADFEVLPSVGSDHYPIRADIVLSD